MKSQTFQHEMTQTSSVFGRKSDLKVVFKGDGAATNGETVYLPAIAHDKEVDAETQMVMRGYVDHEAGHNRHSDMPLIMKTYEQWHKEGKPVLKGLAPRRPPTPCPSRPSTRPPRRARGCPSA